MKTKAAVIEAQNAPLKIMEITVPKLKPGQVLVEIAYSGVCQTQLNEIKGVKGPDRFLPHLMGHEGSGKVLQIGKGVTKVKVGDHVVLSWLKGEGADVPNSHYECNGQTINSGAITTFQKHAVISENRMNPIPKEMPLKEAALLGCAIPTGAGSILNDMKVQEGNSVAIFGAGGVGLSAILAASFSKAFPIIAVDISEEKFERARSLGATHCINAKEQTPSDAIMEITEGKGVDYSLESAGRKEAMEMAFSALKAPGLCVIAGNIPFSQKIEINPFDLIRGKNIIGTWGGGSTIDKDIPYYCDLFLKKSFSMNRLITHEIKLEEINELFSDLEKGKVGRGIINLAM